MKRNHHKKTENIAPPTSPTREVESAEETNVFETAAEAMKASVSETDAAPANEETSTPKKLRGHSLPPGVAAMLRITLPLTIICIAVALMLAIVNCLTVDAITENEHKEKENAVRAIFEDADAIELYGQLDDAEIYLVTRGDTLLGSCVSLSENGFGGAISLMVGVNASGEVCGVRIISMSETPGFGTRAKNDSFLAGFSGSQAFVIGENFDALSGATITSRAVVRGVNRAMALAPTSSSATPSSGDDTEMENIPASTPETDPAVSPNPPTTETADTESSSVAALPTPDVTTEEEDDAVASRVNIAWADVSAAATVSPTKNRVTVTARETIYADGYAVPEETIPAEPETAEAEPVETIPAESESTEAEPIETIPAEPETTETEPVETIPAEPETAETEPVETIPAEPETTETEPVETIPAEPETAEAEPVETMPDAPND